MPRYIAKIYSNYLGSIGLGERIAGSGLGNVREIDFSYGSTGEYSHKESYIVLFEDSKEELEVFDVVYVIRREYKNE